MHQDYSEGFVASDREQWPDETRAGEICVKRLLAGERGHYGPDGACPDCAERGLVSAFRDATGTDAPSGRQF
jgi:hypothetical protein